LWFDQNLSLWCHFEIQPSCIVCAIHWNKHTFISAYCTKHVRVHLAPKFSSDQTWVVCQFGQPLTYPYFTIFSLSFCITPYNRKLQGSFHYTKWSSEQKVMVVFLLKLQFVPVFNLELSHVALSPVLPLFHELPCFPTLKLSSLYLVIFGHPYLTHMKSHSIIFGGNLTHQFLHIHPLDFPFKENFLAFKLREDSMD
jgi:hypothetical protein